MMILQNVVLPKETQKQNLSSNSINHGLPLLMSRPPSSVDMVLGRPKLIPK